MNTGSQVSDCPTRCCLLALLKSLNQQFVVFKLRKCQSVQTAVTVKGLFCLFQRDYIFYAFMAVSNLKNDEL